MINTAGMNQDEPWSMPLAASQNLAVAAEHAEMAQYAEAARRLGRRAVPGSQGSLWLKYERAGLMRLPVFSTFPPQPRETQRVLRSGRAVVAAYLLEPCDICPANAWLYIRRGRMYSVDTLDRCARQNVRKAVSSLRIGFLDWQDLFGRGFDAYRDTRRRAGLSDGTPESFRARFAWFSRMPGHHAVGAWLEDRIVAFMSVVAVDDWVEIEGSFSTDGDRGLRPNDGLASFIFQRFVAEGQCRVVTCGLSSIQDTGSQSGLHRFKLNIGFEAIPVHRSFALHPLLRPLASPVGLAIVRRLLYVRPADRKLKKIHGILASFVDKKDLEEVCCGGDGGP